MNDLGSWTDRVRSARLICGTWLMALGLAACSGGKDEDEPQPDLDLQRNWLLVAATYEGHEFDFSETPTSIPDANLVLTKRGDAQANAGCTTANVTVEVDGHNVSIEVLEIGSMRSCLPYVYDPMEGKFQESLERVESGSISGDELVLTGALTELTFVRAGARNE